MLEDMVIYRRNQAEPDSVLPDCWNRPGYHEIKAKHLLISLKWMLGTSAVLTTTSIKSVFQQPATSCLIWTRATLPIGREPRSNWHRRPVPWTARSV